MYHVSYDSSIKRKKKGGGGKVYRVAAKAAEVIIMPQVYSHIKRMMKRTNNQAIHHLALS